MSENDAARAAELFAQLGSVNGVAKAMEIDWVKAKKLLGDLVPSKTGGGKRKSKPRKNALAVREAEPADDAEPEELELTLRLPTERVDAMLASFTPQEKYDAVATILQQRLNAALGLES